MIILPQTTAHGGCDGRKCTSVLENGSEYSLMLNNGVPPIVVSRILGHSKPSITLDLDGHLYHEMQDKAAKIMDELVTPIKVELPSNEVLDDKLHQTAPICTRKSKPAW